MQWWNHTQNFCLEPSVLKPPISWLTWDQTHQSDIKDLSWYSGREKQSSNYPRGTWASSERPAEHKATPWNNINIYSLIKYKLTLISLWLQLTFLVSVRRPTELFRSCNIQSDQGAMNDIKLWSNGTIKMPFMNIPVLDIRKCLPNMWKAVACSLQIKPCHSKFRGSVICKYVY